MRRRNLKNCFKRFLQVYHRILRAFGINQFFIIGRNNLIENYGEMSKVFLKIVGNDNYIEIGEGSKVSNLAIRIKGDRHRIIIGKNCIYNGGTILFEDCDGQLNLGQDSTIGGASFYITEPKSKITIGRDCMFSFGIKLWAGDTHSLIDLETGKRINYAKDIFVGEHVWVGSNAVILKGVKIGESAVIGSSSVVTKDVESHSVVAGNPARLVRSNISWTRERIYSDR